MFKKPLLITFEGIEGSGKSYHSKRLFTKAAKMNLPVMYTREPGGAKSAEQIRKLILNGNKNKFDKFTDALLYLAARNENFKKKILPSLKNKKIIICDRFIDSTIAYQTYGYGINKKIINLIHNEILNNIKADFTFLLTIGIKNSIKRVSSKKNINRYDRLSKEFYLKVQNGFKKLSKLNKNKYLVLNTSKDPSLIERLIFDKFLNIIKK